MIFYLYLTFFSRSLSAELVTSETFSASLQTISISQCIGTWLQSIRTVDTINTLDFECLHKWWRSAQTVDFNQLAQPWFRIYWVLIFINQQFIRSDEAYDSINALCDAKFRMESSCQPKNVSLNKLEKVHFERRQCDINCGSGIPF